MSFAGSRSLNLSGTSRSPVSDTPPLPTFDPETGEIVDQEVVEESLDDIY